MPVRKCPFLSQYTVQQVRSSASHILKAGVESCPILSQWTRKVSTSSVQNSSSLSSTSKSSATRPLTIAEIKNVHDKMRDQKHQQHFSSKVKPITSSINLTKKPNPYGESKKNIIIQSV